MRTLSFPKPTNTLYPTLRFTDLANMRRQTEYNRKAFIGWVRQQPFNVENENLLVGLLQQLSINAGWDLEYVVGYTRFRAYSLCTLFKITSLHQVGVAHKDGFYRNNAREHWCLIENTKTYSEDTLSIDELRPVIPLCSTVTQHGYSHPLTRDKADNSTVGDLAIMGVDLVELAVGWWLYQRMGMEKDGGPGAYIAQYPFVQAQLIHNQLSVINILYEHLIHSVPINKLISFDSVIFTTVSEKREFVKYIEFLVNFYKNRRLESFEHFLVAIDSIYAQPYFNYVSAGRAALFSQTQWIWEPPILKLYSIYLKMCTVMKVKASDVNTIIGRTHRSRVQNFSRVPESYFKGWFYQLCDETYALNLENLKP